MFCTPPPGDHLPGTTLAFFVQELDAGGVGMGDFIYIGGLRKEKKGRNIYTQTLVMKNFSTREANHSLELTVRYSYSTLPHDLEIISFPSPRLSD